MRVSLLAYLPQIDGNESSRTLSMAEIGLSVDTATNADDSSSTAGFNPLH